MQLNEYIKTTREAHLNSIKITDVYKNVKYRSKYCQTQHVYKFYLIIILSDNLKLEVVGSKSPSPLRWLSPCHVLFRDLWTPCLSTCYYFFSHCHWKIEAGLIVKICEICHCRCSHSSSSNFHSYKLELLLNYWRKLSPRFHHDFLDHPRY